MYFREYDIIVDALEANIKSDLKDILELLKRQLGMTSGKIESIFKDCYPEDVTLNNYYKDRKAYRTMEAILNNPGVANEEIALEFGYTGYTVFFRWFKKIYGKSPKDVMLSKEFSVPPVLHAKEIIAHDDSLAPSNLVIKRSKKDRRESELILVDRITLMRGRISQLEKELRFENDKQKISSIEGEILRLKMKIAEAEDRLNIQLQEPVVIKGLTPGLFAEFVRIEECKAIYGIGINKIIELYNKSIEEGTSLDELCDWYSEMMFLADQNDYDEEDEDLYYGDDDPDMSYLIDEMSLAESWQYYNDDDAEDPYAEIEPSEEYYY